MLTQSKNTLTCPEEQRELATLILNPTMQSALSLESCSELQITKDAGFSAMADQLSELSLKLHHGNTEHVQSLLLSQAVVLDAIFSNLLRRGINTQFGGIKEPLLRIALKAQKQSRQTLGTLAAMHQPKAATLIQNNHAINQQVNNTSNEVLAMETLNG